MKKVALGAAVFLWTACTAQAAVTAAEAARLGKDLTELLTLAWPVVISRVGFMTMGLIDTLVVARYSTEQLGFHALAWAVSGVVLTTGLGLLSGVQVMTARHRGEGRPQATGVRENGTRPLPVMSRQWKSKLRFSASTRRRRSVSARSWASPSRRMSLRRGRSRRRFARCAHWGRCR